jgi:hypothetical protein
MNAEPKSAREQVREHLDTMRMDALDLPFDERRRGMLALAIAEPLLVHLAEHRQRDNSLLGQVNNTHDAVTALQAALFTYAFTASQGDANAIKSLIKIIALALNGMADGVAEKLAAGDLQVRNINLRGKP